MDTRRCLNARPLFWFICLMVANSARSEFLTIKRTSLIHDSSESIVQKNYSEAITHLNIELRNGTTVFVSVDLWDKLENESRTSHWHPWQRTRMVLEPDDVLRELECLPGNSLDSFPTLIMTDEQLSQGGFLIYVVVGIYAFTLLALVCNDYFIPCVEFICEDLKIPQDVAAATFMSVATSCPEFFINLISTFLTESDMGIGTIVGSGLFNALGVAAIGGLAAIRPIKIESRPVTRDVIIYIFNLSLLIAIIWDGQIDWYESLILVVAYVLYFIIMFNSVRLFRWGDKVVDLAKNSCCKKQQASRKNSITNSGKVESHEKSATTESKEELTKSTDEDDLLPEEEDSPWRFPKGGTKWKKAWWIYKWPLMFILSITIPSTVTHKRFYPFAFFMCIVWIGVNSYFVTWSMTVIGSALLIPESIMGMTFLAFGGCLPEACSIFIMSRRGLGGIGVSNALGANSLAILFALGVPWFVRCMVYLAEGVDSAVLINSTGIEFIITSLLIAVLCLWIVLFIGKFYLRKSVGFVAMLFYLVFLTLFLLIETGVILDLGLPVC